MRLVSVLILAIFVFTTLQGCDSEKTRLETEKQRLEFERQQAEAARKKAWADSCNTDKLDKVKPSKDPF